MKAARLSRPSGAWAPPLYDAEAVARSTAARLRQIEGPFHLRYQGSVWGPWLPRSDAVERFAHKLFGSDVGTQIFVSNTLGKGVRGRIVDVDPKPADTIGSPGVDLVVGLLFASFAGRWQNGGIYNYRHIDGSSSWSDHAYVGRDPKGRKWCGRAVDWFPESMATGDEIARAVKGELASHLSYLLWRVSGHYSHGHASMDDGGAPGSC